MKNKVALISLGCAKNLVDSEVMLGYLQKSGYQIITEPEKSDYVIINTCGFIQPARQEAEEAIKDILKLKQKDPNKTIVVAGCYVKKDQNRLQRLFPNIDIWTGVNDFFRIVPLLEGASFTASTETYLYQHDSPRLLSTPSSWAYVKISEGCSHKCSFCAIPQIKGKYRSREINSIVEEAKTLAAAGVNEINLISHDTTFYGRDRAAAEDLVVLLGRLIPLKGLDWIRLLYAYPEEISDPLLDIMQEQKICSYFDIPFQHAAAPIINKMGRGMADKKALNLLDRIRRKLPDAAIRTSLIVGFPGETEQEFGRLKNFTKQAEFEHLGVFTYSPEAGTDSFLMEDTVEEAVKTERKNEIMEMQQEISYQKNTRYLNTYIDVLLEGDLKQDPSIIVGRSQYQAPEVDGLVFVNKNNEIKSKKMIQKVEITDCDVYDLYGNLKP